MNKAAERAAGSLRLEKLSGAANVIGASAEFTPVTDIGISATISKANNAVRLAVCLTEFMIDVSRHQKIVLAQIALWIGQNHVAHSLVIFDIAGAAAEMAVKSFQDRLVEVGAWHLRFRQALQQYLAFVQKSGRAVAALKREMFNERLLQHGELPVLRMSLDSADRLAGEACRGDDTGRTGLTRAIGIVDDHRATQALRASAAEFCAGQSQIFAQEIVHRQFVANLDRPVSLAVDRYAHRGHWSTPLIMA